MSKWIAFSFVAFLAFLVAACGGRAVNEPESSLKRKEKETLQVGLVTVGWEVPSWAVLVEGSGVNTTVVGVAHDRRNGSIVGEVRQRGNMPAEEYLDALAAAAEAQNMKVEEEWALRPGGKLLVWEGTLKGQGYSESVFLHATSSGFDALLSFRGAENLERRRATFPGDQRPR